MTEPKVKTEKSSGGSEIEVKTSVVNIPKAEAEEEIKEEELPRAEGEEVGVVNKALIETVVRVLGKTLALVTKIPEMDFDESETEQLVNLWSPLAPKLSPVTMAVIGTIVIAGGKVGIYMAKRPRGLPKTVESLEVKEKVKTTEEQLEEDFRTQ